MAIKATLYTRPNGRQEEIQVRNIRPDDEAWFIEHDVQLSMEDAPGQGHVVYGDYGRTDEDGEPVEMVVFSKGRSCEDTLTELRQLIEEALKA